MDKNKIIVGTDRVNYAQQRNFFALPMEHIKFKKTYSITKLPTHLIYKLGIKTKFKDLFLNSFYDFNLNQVDGYHFFNTLSFGQKPYVTTFETNLPRWGKPNKTMTKVGHNLLAKQQCKRLIALSNCTANFLRTNLGDNNYPLADLIESKLLVLHPPQNLILEKKPLSKKNKVEFTIIGSDFFRKGGMEVLSVFDYLKKKGYDNWHLNIVSSMNYGDYASKTTKTNFLEASKLIGNMSNNITHYKRLENPKVLQLLKKTDIGLLPTYADTYGYSVLEAQAAGCPVITTDIRALPEINNKSIGWIINVPKDEFGNGKLNSDSDRRIFSERLKSQLIETTQDILEANLEQINTKGNLAIEKIRKHNNPATNARVLKAIYNEFVTLK
jgi:glycosyltransferase involved in cell wall biosynthesis